MPDIKKCPVCGAEAELKQTMVEYHEWLYDKFYVECHNKHRVKRDYLHDKDYQAINAWNAWDGEMK